MRVVKALGLSPGSQIAIASSKLLGGWLAWSILNEDMEYFLQKILSTHLQSIPAVLSTTRRMVRKIKWFVSLPKDSFGVTGRPCAMVLGLLQKKKKAGEKLESRTQTTKDRPEGLLFLRSNLCTSLPLAGGKD